VMMCEEKRRDEEGCFPVFCAYQDVVEKKSIWTYHEYEIIRNYLGKLGVELSSLYIRVYLKPLLVTPTGELSHHTSEAGRSHFLMPSSRATFAMNTA
jgi:hypothetical protein